MIRRVFFGDLSEKSKDVSHPTQYLYMRMVKILLRVIVSWPQEQLGLPPVKLQALKKSLVVLQEAVLVPSIGIYIYSNTGELDFFRLGHAYITLFMTLTTLKRLPMSLNSDYKKLFHEYIQTFHLFHHKDKSEYANQTHLLVHNISHFFTIMLTSQMCIGIFLFNATPLYNNMSSGVFKDNSLNRTYELSVYVTLPIGDPERDLRYYVAVMLFDWHISFFCSVTFCMFDLYLSLMIFQIWGHLRILKHELLVFTKPKHGQCLYSDVESNLVNLKLKKLVQYHCFIMNFANQVSNTFGGMIFAYYVFHQVSCCLLLLECSQLDPKAVARYGPLTLIVFQQLMQISVVFELVGSKSEELIEATYNLPWQCMDASRRAVVQLLLMRVQRPLHLKALGMTDVGVRSMATIIKTSMSYFTLLRNS